MEERTEKSIDEQILELKKAIAERKAGADLEARKEYKGIPLTELAEVTLQEVGELQRSLEKRLYELQERQLEEQRTDEWRIDAENRLKNEIKNLIDEKIKLAKEKLEREKARLETEALKAERFADTKFDGSLLLYEQNRVAKLEAKGGLEELINAYEEELTSNLDTVRPERLRALEETIEDTGFTIAGKYEAGLNARFNKLKDFRLKSVVGDELTDYPAIVKQLKIIRNYEMQVKIFEKAGIEQ